MSDAELTLDKLRDLISQFPPSVPPQLPYVDFSKLSKEIQAFITENGIEVTHTDYLEPDNTDKE